MKMSVMYTISLLGLVWWSVGCAPRGKAVSAAEVNTTRVARAQPLEVWELSREIQGMPVRGWAVQIELRGGRVEVVVTDPLPQEVGDGTVPERAEAKLERTRDWAARAGVLLAVNANFFGKVGDPLPGYRVGGWSEIVGLSVSDGLMVSQVRCPGEQGACDPAAVFSRDGMARVLPASEAEAAQAWDAVAGVGALLVEDGVNIGAGARVEPAARHPRTAVGVSADGGRLWLVVIDGRQPGWSVGMTLPELAELMIELGAHDAVNLDGGGSTEMAATGVLAESLAEAGGGTSENGVLVLNRPSDRGGRPVANHLGFRVR